MTAATTVLTRPASAATPDGSPPRPLLTGDERRSRPFVAGVTATGSGRRAGSGVRSTSTTVEDLLRRRAELPGGHPDRAVLRGRAIEAALPLSRYLAAKYQGRGEPLEDLRQVAAVALIKAVDGYDPARPVPFSAYAVPTMIGGLKRHFRDTTWRIRVPRRVQELALTLAPASADLAQRLGRSPTLTDLATDLGATEHDIAVASDAWGAHSPASLDGLTAHDDPARPALVDALGAVDPRFDVVDDQHVLRCLLDGLPLRERRILVMRFCGEMSQAEIAMQIGVSQMQISRLLLKSLTALRTGLPTKSPTLRAAHPRT